jgi:hypothetical protein
MIEKILGLEKMNILQCQAAAKQFGFNSTTFDLVGPKGRMKAKWIDAYMGIFGLEGQDGFAMVHQIQFIPNLHCENLSLSTTEDKPNGT